MNALSVLTLIVRCQGEHFSCEKFECRGEHVVICLERDADDLHMVQLMPLPPSPQSQSLSC